MNDDQISVAGTAPTAPRWQPLSARDRRVLGVLAEKAKTTPDAYPMTLNSIVTGCNQKSNRAPLMQFEPEDAQESLDRLREMGAVGMVEGYGRVTKYRHYLYEWLGVEKIELSVITELLLRGAQTEGDLRGRVSRMDPIADLPALRTLLASLKAKGLVVPLTPEGRGHVVSHHLYSPREFEHVQAQFAQQGASAAAATEDETAGAARPAPGPEPLRRELDELRAQLSQLRNELEDLGAQQQRLSDEIRGLKDSLGGV